MNSISGILSREQLNKNDKINIIWTEIDQSIFKQNIKKIGHNLLNFDQLYFGKDSPHLIICNNKILFYEKCKNISIQFHIPILMIDHDIKPKNITETQTYTLPCTYKVALNEKIASSWSEPYHKTLDKHQSNNIDIWSEIIFKTYKKLFQYYE